METLVSSFLLGITCTLMMTFFVYALRQTQRNLLRQELILGGEKVVDRVIRSYMASHDTYILANTSINGVLIAQASAVNSSKLIFDTSGNLTWSSWKAFGYDSAKGQVWQAWQAFVTPVASGGELTTGPTVLLPANWSRRVISQNVSLFSVTGPSNGVIRVRVVLSDRNGYQVEIASSGDALN
ncbi:MAG: hypothetical protein KF760_20445 [Candidatus Eremiobacteraeota bacterium]|nr:hypothetical protein [Candidatus Eremiobacteraeota bacterium]MCW5872145.1 hypothetical protein [Candidatus Eremiobacteraeota bacterium]